MVSSLLAMAWLVALTGWVTIIPDVLFRSLGSWRPTVALLLVSGILGLAVLSPTREGRSVTPPRIGRWLQHALRHDRPSQLLVAVSAAAAVVVATQGELTALLEAFVLVVKFGPALAGLVLFTAALWLLRSRQRRATLVALAMLPIGLYVVAELVNLAFDAGGMIPIRSSLARNLLTGALVLTVYQAWSRWGDAVRGVRLFLRTYVGLSLVVAAGGLAAWSLITFGLVNPDAWRPPAWLAGELAHRGTDLFSMPFYLGVVGANPGAIQTLGWYRAAGFSAEPQFAGLFGAPSFFLLGAAFPKWSRWRKQAGRALLLTFLFAVFSVTTISITVVLIGIVAARYAWRNKRDPRTAWTITAITVPLVTVILVANPSPLDFVVRKFTGGSGETLLRYHARALSSSAFFGNGLLEFDYANPATSEIALLPYLSGMTQAGVYALAGITLFLHDRDGPLAPLAMTYVALHYLRGPGQMIFKPFYFNIVLITVLVIVERHVGGGYRFPSIQGKHPSSSPQGQTSGS